MTLTDLVNPAALIERLETQRDLFRRLRGLADRQRALVEGDDPAPLLAVLADRQRLVDDLCRCNAELAPYRRNWAAVLDRLAPEARDRVRTLLDENDGILGSILESDRADADVLSRRRRATGEQLSRNVSGARANRAYAAAGAAGDSKWTDAHA